MIPERKTPNEIQPQPTQILKYQGEGENLKTNRL